MGEGEKEARPTQGQREHSDDDLRPLVDAPVDDSRATYGQSEHGDHDLPPLVDALVDDADLLQTGGAGEQGAVATPRPIDIVPRGELSLKRGQILATVAEQPVYHECLGMEFETDVAVYSKSTLEYQLLLYKMHGARWKVVADGVSKDKTEAVLEFVIEPIDDHQELDAVMVEIADFIGDVIAHCNDKEIALADMVARLGTRWRNADVATGVVVNVRGRSFVGAPQASIGLPVRNITSFLHHATRFRLDEHVEELESDYAAVTGELRALTEELKELEAMGEGDGEPAIGIGPTSRSTARITCRLGELRADIQKMKEMAQDMKSRQKLRLLQQHSTRFGSGANNPWDLVHAWVYSEIDPTLQNKRAELGGLLTLVLMYLNEGFYAPGSLKYAKSCFSVLSRTNFCAIFNAIQRPVEFTVELVCSLWQSSAEQLDKPVILHGFAHTDPLMDVRGTIHESKEAATIYPPSIRDWVISISNSRRASEIVDTKSHAQGGKGKGKGKNIARRQLTGAEARIARRILPSDPCHSHLQNMRAKDLMSRGVCADNSISMGLYDDLKWIEHTDGVRRGYVIVEFREWPEISINYGRWRQLALRLFDFYVDHVNKPWAG